MKNDECVINLVSGNGWKQVYKKDKKGWVQITNGVVRRMTSEQLLSHILPVIAWNKEGIKYRKGFRLVVKEKRK